MNLKEKEFAIKIISNSNSPKVSFNVPVSDNYSHVHDILIHQSNSDLTSKLAKAGFSLSMTSKGLSVHVIFKIDYTYTYL